MAESNAWRRVIASYVPIGALAGRTHAALRGLGYQWVPVTTRGRFDDDSWTPDIRIVDERHLDRVPTENYLPRTPIVLLTGADRPERGDARIAGCVARPAALDRLYPILQAALEDRPRQSPRVRTNIQARCSHADRRWMGALVSLSRGGGLIRTADAMPEGLELNLLFPLPLGRMISTRARVVGQHADQMSMTFSLAPGSSLDAIGDFVERRLAAQSALAV